MCARCLGTYLTAVIAVVAQVSLRARSSHALDWPVGLGLMAPATVDWVWARFEPHRFSNAWRTLTGVGLGMALGRSLYLHLRTPFPLLLVAQAGVTLVAVSLVVLGRYVARKR